MDQRMKWKGKDGPRSSTVIAQLLDAEGWTDHVANQIEGWWRRANIEKDYPEIDRLKRGLGEIATRLSDDERKVLGKFIGLHMRMGFDTGLRMGMAVALVKVETTQNGKEVSHVEKDKEPGDEKDKEQEEQPKE